MGFKEVVLQSYEELLRLIPKDSQWIIILFIFTLLMVAYSIFVYFFYRFLAKKNIINLNLSKYNTSDHPILMKFMAVIFYIIEYIVILPVITFVWFIVLSIFLLVMSKIDNVSTILMISAALIASVRIVSYYTEDLSKDIAKLIPLALLAMFLVEPTFFSLQVIATRFGEIPKLLSSIPLFLVYIVVIEFLMRILELLGMGISGQEDTEEKD